MKTRILDLTKNLRLKRNQVDNFPDIMIFENEKKDFIKKVDHLLEKLKNPNLDENDPTINIELAAIETLETIFIERNVGDLREKTKHLPNLEVLKAHAKEIEMMKALFKPYQPKQHNKLWKSESDSSSESELEKTDRDEEQMVVNYSPSQLKK